MIKRYVAAAFMAATLFLTATTAFGTPEDFQSFLKDNPTVKVYVELTNSSGDDKVDINSLKKHIEEGFAARKSHNFTIADTAIEADIIFKGDVVEYVWMAEDPVDQVWGVGAAAMDALIIENYARIQVNTKLISAKHNHLLWSDKVKATMTQKVMPKETSYEIVYPRFVKSVMIEIFRKHETGTL